MARLLPILEWLPRLRRADLQRDLLAGFTTAVMIIPQAMGYAMLAGLPPIVGLYAALTPLVAYALLGTSRELSVGPVAMDSILVATAINAIAASGYTNVIAVASTLGVMVGVIQFTLGLLRMGFVVNFLSRPVISGFTTAASLIIGASQLPHLLAVDLPRTHHVHRVLAEALSQLREVHGTTLLLGGTGLVALILLKRFAPRFPRALVVVVASTAAAAGLGLGQRGVALVGEVPAGLPSFSLPLLDSNLWQQLAPSAFTIALLSFMEAISVGRHFARKGRYEVYPSRELVALGAANLAGGLFGGYPVAGGFSRTAVNAAAGAKSQFAALVTVAIVALTLVWLTPLFSHMPKAILAAIILAAVIGLVDFQEARRLWKVKRSDFALLGFTAAMTLSAGIQWGIALGVGASLLLFLVRTTRPHFAVLGRVPGTEAYLNVQRHPHTVVEPGVLLVRIDAQLYFGNVSFLKEALLRLEREASTPVHTIVLDQSGINDLDSSAESALTELDEEFAARGVRLLFARVKGPVRDVLYRSGLLARLDSEGRIFFRTHDAVEYAVGRAPGPAHTSPQLQGGDPRAPADRVGCGTLRTAACTTDEAASRLPELDGNVKVRGDESAHEGATQAANVPMPSSELTTLTAP